ncbi:hypothetical protein EZS27_026037 [termite gut metagenome]|uniref:Uncharacterized protein n=1 Tax=termite gut metagenome TaxID=433724 RepID=A0A5J4QTV3_9ZZZZ
MDISINNNNQQKEDLFELINLLEKVTDNIESLKAQITKSKLSSFFFILGLCVIIIFVYLICYIFDTLSFLPLINQPFSLIFSIVIILLVVFSFALGYYYYSRQIRKLYVSLRKEQTSLYKLLEFADEVKKLAFKECNFTVVEKAVIEVRLSRIEFGEKDMSREPKFSVN